MKRGIRTLTFVAALVLVVATLALWARSYGARDGVWYSTESTRYGAHSYRGEVLLWRLSVAPTPTAMAWVSPAKLDAGFVWDSTPDAWYDQFASHPMRVAPTEVFKAPAAGAAVDRRFMGFRRVRSDAWFPRAQLMHGYPAAESSALYVPHWAIAAVACTAPATGIIGAAGAARAARRRRRGLCAECGYDLRATPTQCPECGAGGAAAPV